MHRPQVRVERVARPYYGLRIAAAAIIIVSLGTLIYSVSQLNLSLAGLKFGELMQATDASLNNVVFIGAALFFVITFETRLKRTRVLHERWSELMKAAAADAAAAAATASEELSHDRPRSEGFVMVPAAKRSRNRRQSAS